MSRIETIGNATLYLGDCREILPTLPKVDLVLTDPPYGISYCHGGGGKSKLPGVSKIVQKISANGHLQKIYGDDEPFDPAPLFDLGELVFVFGADHFKRRLPDGGTFVAWDKSIGIGPADSFADAEFAWCNWRIKRNVARFLWKGVCSVKEGEDKERSHPTQKPISLMKWCLESSPKTTSTVADPFMGSGTTGVACANLGKTFYGIERDPKYFDIACKRIENAYRQARLFA